MQVYLKEEIDNTTIVIGNFNTPLSAMNSSPGQKINKKTLNSTYTLDQIDQTDIHRTFHPGTEEDIAFSNTHGTFSRLDHTMGHQIRLSKFKKIEIKPCVLSNHNGIKLEINNKKKIGKSTICGIKQHSPEKPKGQRRNQNGNKKIS